MYAAATTNPRSARRTATSGRPMPMYRPTSAVTATLSPYAGMKLTDMYRKTKALAAIEAVPNTPITHIWNADQASTSATVWTPDGMPTRSSVPRAGGDRRTFDTANVRRITGRGGAATSTAIPTNTRMFWAHAAPTTPWGRAPKCPNTSVQEATALTETPATVAAMTARGRSTASRNWPNAVPTSLNTDPAST